MLFNLDRSEVKGAPTLYHNSDIVRNISEGIAGMSYLCYSGLKVRVLHIYRAFHHLRIFLRKILWKVIAKVILTVIKGALSR